MTSAPAPRRTAQRPRPSLARSPRQRAEAWTGALFVLGFALPFLVFNVAPILFGAYVSLTEWGIIGSPRFVGLANYERAINDRWLILAFWNVGLYALVITPAVVILGLAFALYVDRGFPLSGLVRTAFFAPYVVSATVIGLVWVWLLDTRHGLFNAGLALFGINPVPWLTSTDWALYGVALASIWWDLGLVFILLLAALQECDRELHEAAEIDGASRWQRFRHVTLPQLRPALSMVLTLQLIATMRIFSQVYVMTNGGPAGSSSSVITHIYQTALVQNLMGYASAISMMLFAAIMLVTVIQRRLFREVRNG